MSSSTNRGRNPMMSLTRSIAKFAPCHAPDFRAGILRRPTAGLRSPSTIDHLPLPQRPGPVRIATPLFRHGRFVGGQKLDLAIVAQSVGLHLDECVLHRIARAEYRMA